MVSAASREPLQSAPAIIPRSEHGISRANISGNALKVLYRLKDAGFEAYLVGGGVRDLLLGREPKDFDVATAARPEELRSLFRNCRLIGRRFRLAHIHFGREIVEVATFRAMLGGDDPGEVLIEDGRILRDNVYGTLEQDAWRRDFTVNALYYDIRDFSVVDYTGGMEDLRAGSLAPIGDARLRYREDPVRMLRALRFAAKLGFKLHPDNAAAIDQLGYLLADMPPARLFEEVLKMLHGGCGHASFELLRRHDLFKHLFPMTEAALAHEADGFPMTFVSRALNNTDERINAGKSVTPAFLYAVFLWLPVRERAGELQAQGKSQAEALQIAGAEVTVRQAQHTALPKRLTLPMREIWAMQPRFAQRVHKRAQRLLSHPRFRAGYDFMCLRAAAGDAPEEDAQWWTHFQEAGPDEQQRIGSGRRKRPRRRSRARSADGDGGGDG